MANQIIQYYPYNGFNPFFTVWVKKLPGGRVVYGANDFIGNPLLRDLDHVPSLDECLAEFRVQEV